MAENTVPLTDLDRTQLLELVEALKIKGVKDKAKPAIIEAISAEQARLAAERDAGQTVEPDGVAPDESGSADTQPPPAPDEDEGKHLLDGDGGDGDGGDPPQDDEDGGDPPQQQQVGKVMGEPLTSEQRDKMRAAGVDRLIGVLDDPDLPLLWRQEFQREVDRRGQVERMEAHRRDMTSEIERYEITKGGPFVVDGRVTALRTGGVISRFTHDLKEVRRQGIEIERLVGEVVVSSDSMGFTTSHIQRAPKDVPKMTGEAPEPPPKP